MRHEIATILSGGIATRESLMLRQDLDEYLKAAQEDKLQWAQSHEKKMEALQELKKFAEVFVHKSREYARQYFDAINKYERTGVLTKQNADNAREVALKRSKDWNVVKAFFEKDSKESFKQWQSNWEDFADAQKRLSEHNKKLKIKDDDLPELKELKSSEYKNGKFMYRYDKMHAALNAVVAHEYRYNLSYKRAEGILQQAARKRGLSETKVPFWLTHIFTKYSPQDAENFILRTLPGYAEEWIDLNNKYQNDAKEARKRGIAVLSEAQFLSLNYHERKAEYNELHRRLDIAENPLIRDIESSIEDLDWKHARVLLAKAQSMKLSDEEEDKVMSMQRYVEANEYEDTANEGNETPKQKLERTRGEMWTALDDDQQCPMSTSKLYKELLEEDGMGRDGEVEEDGRTNYERQKRTRAAIAGHYNIKWALEHGHLDDERLGSMRDESTQDTEIIAENGHRQKGRENINLNHAANIDHSIFRPFEAGARGPTYYHYSKESTGKLKQDINQRAGDFYHNYWFLLDPMDVSLERIVRVVDTVHPKIKAYFQARQEYDQSKLQSAPEKPKTLPFPQPSKAPASKAG